VPPGREARGFCGVEADESGDRPPPRKRRRGPRKLEPHRMALALGLVSTAPPMIIRYGWPGVLAAVAAVGYAIYLLAGKRFPRRRR
jgi:hypothetical protein